MKMYFCAGCQSIILDNQVRNLAGVGKMCKLCGSGRVTPVKEKPDE